MEKTKDEQLAKDARVANIWLGALHLYGHSQVPTETIAVMTGWTFERTLAALEHLERSGMVGRNRPAPKPKPKADEFKYEITFAAGTFSNVLSASAISPIFKVIDAETVAVVNDPIEETTGATAPAGEDMESTESVKLKDIGIKRTGTELVVPDGVSYATAIQALQLKQKEEETDIGINHQFEMTVPEGLFALARALKDMCGFVSPTATPGMFGPTPPQFLGLEIGPGEVEMVPWGRFLLPNITGYLETSIWGEEAPKFRLCGVVKGRDKMFIDKLAQHMRESIKTDSIYRGKAIRCDFPKVGETNSIEAFFPKFMKLDDVREEHLILNDDAKLLIQTALFTPIERSEKCRQHKIPLKRGILLEGPFGVGKTLSATVTAQKCIKNGWTFIHLNNVANLAVALEFARQYQPAVIFAEDIDQVVADDDDDRDEEVNNILNQIDGIESKGTEIITVLTTNNLANITTAMLRPGRLDAVVSVRAPDAKASQQLVRLYAGTLLAADDDLTSVGNKLAGMIPAVIREVVERSKLGAIRRDSETINAQDIEVAADGMKAHSEMLEPDEVDERSKQEKAAAVLVEGGRELVGLLLGSRSGSSNGLALPDASKNGGLGARHATG